MESLTDLIARAIHPDAPFPSPKRHHPGGVQPAAGQPAEAATGGKQWCWTWSQGTQEQDQKPSDPIQPGFGYYIEVTKSYYDLVPLRYVRKQTLANCERYITPELREIEQKIVGAQEQSIRLNWSCLPPSGAIPPSLSPCSKHAGIKTLDALVSLARGRGKTIMSGPR
jgi:DNA mismatch repair protein MutS